MKKLLLLALLFASCSKKNNDKEQTDLLVNKKWVITGYAEQKNNGPIIDKWASLKDYEKDNYYFFHSDHSFLDSDGGKIDPQFTSDTFDTGTWQLYTRNMAMQFKSNNPNFYYFPTYITELTNTTLKWKSYYVAMDTTIYYSTFTAE